MPKPVSVGSGTEVVANPEHDRGLHRRFSAEDKQRLLAEAEACTERGALAALLRRERLYSSQLAAWRVQLEREGEAGLAPRKPGRKALKDAKDRRASRRWSATRRSSRASSSSPRSSLSSKKKPRSCWRPPRASTCHECASLEARDPVVPLKSACAALGLARATLYRHRPRVTRPASGPRCSPRRLSEAQRREVLEVLHEERFIDQPPAEVYAKLLDEGRYLCSVRTMHRLLAESAESGERRAMRPKTHHPVPRLEASAPNQVWTWDITKLATLSRGVFLNLYVVLDLYSRFVVA